jgi:hypothetical protein
MVGIQQQKELAGQKEEPGRPAVGDQQNLAEADDRATLRTRKPPRLYQPPS